ncbi:MAG: hypothetical protein MR938_01655 [Tenericutes bacterium]|nr:hypothetical protein [Mycoplasmatota bacterium]
MKKILMISILIFIGITVNAKENEQIFLTNINGAEMTKTQYNNLLKGFTHDTIITLPKDTIDSLKNYTSLRKVSKTKYVKILTYYENKKIIGVSEDEITSNEFDEITAGSPVYYSTGLGGATSETVETNYKKITLTITSGATITAKHVTLTNFWKTIPKIKSYDVMAIAPGVDSISFNLSGHRSGYQKWDEKMVNYDMNSQNWNIIDKSGIFKKGIGLSQNLVDATTTTLENSMTVTFVCGRSPFIVRGSYQHAIANLSLAESKKYTLGSDGMGNLIIFDSKIKDKYDKTPGVTATLN